MQHFVHEFPSNLQTRPSIQYLKYLHINQKGLWMSVQVQLFFVFIKRQTFPKTEILILCDFSTYYFGQHILFVCIMLSCDRFGGNPYCGGTHCPSSNSTLKMLKVCSPQSLVPIALLLIKHKIFNKQIHQLNLNLCNSTIRLHMKNLLWIGHQHVLLQFTQHIKSLTLQTSLHKRNCTSTSHYTYCSHSITGIQNTVNCTECPLSSLPWTWQLSQDVLTGTGFLCNEATIHGDTT